MGAYKDLTGMQFGKLQVIERCEKKPSESHVIWKCKCDCGKMARIRSNALIGGKAVSCGCLRGKRGIREELLKGQKKEISYTSNKIMPNFSRSSFEPNDYRLDGDIVYVKLDDYNEMICDIEDWMRLKDRHWRLDGAGYVVTSIKKKYTSFHRVVMIPEKGKVVDHINHNKLDNRKNNLRVVTQSENSKNRACGSRNNTGVTGVYFLKNSGKWVAYVGDNGKNIRLGEFDDFDLAVLERKKAEEQYNYL